MTEQLATRIPDEIERLATIVVDAGFKVHKTLGPGLLESAYEHCLAYELTKRGLSVKRQVPRQSYTTTRRLKWPTALTCW